MSHETGERPFTAALQAARDAGRLPLIAEVKVRSPKEGELLAGRDPAALAQTLVAAGAACLSVVTEGPHFGGSLGLLETVAAASAVPVLCKDFVTEPRQVWERRERGAACLLLMVSQLEWPRLQALHAEAHRAGLETLVEVHDEEELRLALTLDLDLDLLGINNRDIRQLECDAGTVANTLRLLGRVPPGVRTISESAISTPDEARRVIVAGGSGVLVGTAILKAADTAAAVRRLVQAWGDE